MGGEESQSPFFLRPGDPGGPQGLSDHHLAPVSRGGCGAQRPAPDVRQRVPSRNRGSTSRSGVAVHTTRTILGLTTLSSRAGAGIGGTTYWAQVTRSAKNGSVGNCRSPTPRPGPQAIAPTKAATVETQATIPTCYHCIHFEPTATSPNPTQALGQCLKRRKGRYGVAAPCGDAIPREVGADLTAEGGRTWTS